MPLEYCRCVLEREQNYAIFYQKKIKRIKLLLLLGQETDTQDSTGNIINKAEEDKLNALDQTEVFTTIKSFIGDYAQIPPMFSAIKINGQKLYNLARRGEEVERPARQCKIVDITITDVDLPRVEMICYMFKRYLYQNFMS